MYSGVNTLAADIRATTQFLPDVYTDAVRSAGGLPVLLPAGATMSEAGGFVRLVDGILLPGGPDIDPSVYGQVMRPETGVPDSDRDRWEAFIFQQAYPAGIPILGICRGMQLMNVALGGTLQQHLEHAELHTGPGYVTHPVRIEPDSTLGDLMSYEAEEVDVTARHHQGVGRLGENLHAVAWAADGTIEAVENVNDDDGFLLGVQWHPERDKDQAVFAGLVAAARTAKMVKENG
jgi:gamma-glutamyl-gamma-aminobutyrate hydrolase PuuD